MSRRRGSCDRSNRGAPLAVAHRNRVPDSAGPMTRVSDTAGFADAVATAGGLPFSGTRVVARGRRCGRCSLPRKSGWATGRGASAFSGSFPNELREEQLREIEECAPPFGADSRWPPRPGRQARKTRHPPTYLHVPAPSLLSHVFSTMGRAGSFFEGRECGGHVGPRTSFVLWDQWSTTPIQAVARGVPATELHCVFAGGIHDARSAAMVATHRRPAGAVGVRIGCADGQRHYLFTEEAVATGAKSSTSFSRKR